MITQDPRLFNLIWSTHKKNPYYICSIILSLQCTFFVLYLFLRLQWRERLWGFAVFLSVVILMCVMAAMQSCTYLNHQLNLFMEKNGSVHPQGFLFPLISFHRSTLTAEMHAEIAPDVFLPQRNDKTKPRPWTKNDKYQNSSLSEMTGQR